MPNWCETDITVLCNDEKKIDELESKINEWTSKNYIENGFGNNWLGNVVLGSGVGTVDDGAETDLSCRGLIIEVSSNGNELIIRTETAWGPMIKMWLKVLEQYLPEATLYYTALEPGSEIYLTNDPDYEGKYCVDAYDLEEEELDTDWQCDERCLIADLQRLLKSEEKDIDKLLLHFSKSQYSDNASIYQWESCPAEELS